jgi:VWFA-related protein
MRAYAAARKFVDTQMRGADLLAIMTFAGGSVRVKQDFTDDHARLRDTIQTFVAGNDNDAGGIRDDVEIGTAFGQDDVEFNILNTDRQLSALQTAVTLLRPLPEQKSLVYFSSGLRLNGTDNQAQLRATTNAAIRASVALFPIDARGLAAQAPLGDATRPSPGGIGMFSGQSAQAANTTFERSQDTLYSLAMDTGGTPTFDSNDLSLGIVAATRAVTSYYLVGYYGTHPAADGRFHRIRVSLNGGLSADLSYRQGYFAVKIPGRELALARRRGAARTIIDFIGEVKDEYGVTVQNVRDKLDITLSDGMAGQLARRPIQYETGFTLLPGRYAIKFLARDAETGRIGTYQTSFTVPNLNRELTRIPDQFRRPR